MQLLKDTLMLDASSYRQTFSKDHALNHIRAFVFNNADSFDSSHMKWQRKRGRPRIDTAEILKLALNISSNRANLHQLLYDSMSAFSIWTRLVKTYQQLINIDCHLVSRSCCLALPLLLSYFITRFLCRLFASL